VLRVAIFLVLFGALPGGCVTKIDVRVIDFDTAEPVSGAIVATDGRYLLPGNPWYRDPDPLREAETDDRGIARALVPQRGATRIFAYKPGVPRSQVDSRSHRRERIRWVKGAYQPVDPTNAYVEVGDDGVLEVRLLQAPPQLRVHLPAGYRGPAIVGFSPWRSVRTDWRFDFSAAIERAYHALGVIRFSRDPDTNTIDANVPESGVLVAEFTPPTPASTFLDEVWDTGERITRGRSVWDTRWTGRTHETVPAKPGGSVNLWHIWPPIYFVGTQYEAQQFESLLLRQPTPDEAKGSPHAWGANGSPYASEPFVDPTLYLRLAVELGDARKAEAELRRRKQQAGTLTEPSVD